jgi:NADPH:quinone reductase-like Zn-dependent oxidoreductase
MKAIIYLRTACHRAIPIPDRDHLPDPVPGERDLLVEVKAISVNPVDTKIRASASEARVLGWDERGGTCGRCGGNAVQAWR